MAIEYLIYDLETFGLDNAYDRIAQFACRRYNEDLEPIDDGLILYCKQPTDYLPSPHACMVTGITPQFVNKNGLCEAEFARRIYFEFEKNSINTIIVGYNNTGFDDKMLRFLFFRNFLNPYSLFMDRSLDCFTLIKAVYFAKKDIFKYRKNEYEKDSLKLEHLTQDNGFEHAKAHDALSDVEATGQVLKHIKDNAADIFDMYSNSIKRIVADEIVKHAIAKSRPFFAIKYSELRDANGTLEYPLVSMHGSYNCINLLLSDDEFSRRLDVIKSGIDKVIEDSELSYKTFDNIKLSSSLFVADEDFFYKGKALGEYKALVENRIKLIKDVLPHGIITPAAKPFFAPNSKKDVDESINDGFLSKDAKDVIAKISTGDEKVMMDYLYTLLADKNDKRQRVKKLYSRFIARNYYPLMSDKLKEAWAKHCESRFMDEASKENFYKIRTLSDFEKEIDECCQQYKDDEKKISIVKELEKYGKEIIAKIAKR